MTMFEPFNISIVVIHLAFMKKLGAWFGGSLMFTSENGCSLMFFTISVPKELILKF